VATVNRPLGPAVAALAAALFALGAPSGASAQAATIRMVTYNAHWGEQIDARTGHWTKKVDLGRIAAGIRRTGAEVAMLQELQVYRVPGRGVVSQAHELARLLGWTRGGVSRHAFFHASLPVTVWCRRESGEQVVRWIHGRPGRCLEHGNAILSKRPLRFVRFVDLWRTAAQDIYGAVEGRGAILAGISVNGRELQLATAHLGRSPAVGTCQLRDVLRELGGLSPLVFAGDFNMEVGTETPNPHCSGVPPRPLEQLSALGFTHGEPGGRTYPAHRRLEAIDHFFTSPGVTAEDVRPVPNCRGGTCASDHRPLRATITLPRAAGASRP
jgi:endonuclease/exonuclease/phosphatase family metal-dependent hydrolase